MPLNQGLQLPFGIQPVNPVLVDSYAGPYNSIAEALAAIPSAIRVQTRFVNIIESGVGKLYWFKDGIADSDLVEFTGGGSGTDGTSGTSGTSGINGTAGTNGTSGTSGTNGAPGSNGTSGSSGTSGSALEFAPNAGLYNPSEGIASTIYNTALDPALSTPTTLGGIPAGTLVSDLNTKTLVSIVDDLLFPSVPPTYTIPTLNLGSSVTGVYEVGITVNPSLTIVGTKNDAGAFTDLTINKNYNGAGVTTIASTSSPVVGSAPNVPDQFGYTNPNNPNHTYTLQHIDSGLVVPPTASTSASSVIYNGTSVYNAGLPKKNNKGVTDTRPAAVRSTNAPQAASSNLTPGNNIIFGWYPYFYGKTANAATPADIVNIIQSGTGFTKVIASGSGSLSMAFNAVGQWPWFVIFSPFATKTAWFENALNSGSIGGPTDLFSAPTTLAINSFDGYWSGISFKIYVAQKVTTLGTAIIS